MKKPNMREQIRMTFACLVLLAFSLAGLGGPLDLQEFINAQLQAGKKRVVVPPGRYRVAPNHGACLSFNNLTNVNIVAGRVEMVCTATSRAIHFEDCRNVRLTGLTIDYDPLPFSEGRITVLAPDKSWAEFQVIEGYPENTWDGSVEIFDPATGELRRETGSWEKNFEPLGDHRYRIAKVKGYCFDAHCDFEQVGDILVANQRFPAGAADHAVVALHCTGLKLEDVTLYASPAFGFLEIRCDGSTYHRCKIDRRPPDDDPVQRGLRRFRSLNADAFHSIEAVKGPAIIACAAKFQGDDCVNIHGTYYLVMASHGRQLRVAVRQEIGIEPGDDVEFIPYQGKRPPDARALKIEPDDPINEAEKKFIQEFPLDEHIRADLLSPRAHFFKITLDRPVPLPMGSGICASRRLGNGCVVRDCDFGYNRSRGIIIKAGRAKVTGNKITHTWMTAVQAGPEFFWWLEAGCPDHVLISDNTIIGCRRPAIEVTAPGGDGKPLPAGALRDIVIRGNSIIQSPWPNIHAASTAGLVIVNNRLTPAGGQVFDPPLTVPWEWGTSPPAALLLEK